MNKCVLNVCQAGNELLCAGYTLYSSANILVLTVGECGAWSVVECGAWSGVMGRGEGRGRGGRGGGRTWAGKHSPGVPRVLPVALPPRHVDSPICLPSASLCLPLPRPTAGKGVYGFTFDPLIGEYILSHPDIKVPNKGKIYSFNEGNYQVCAVPCKGCGAVPAVGALFVCGRGGGLGYVCGCGGHGGHECRVEAGWGNAPNHPAGRPHTLTAHRPLHPPPLQLWTPEQRAYIDSLKEPSLWGGKPYSSRYIGSLVGDFHRTLLYGE